MFDEWFARLFDWLRRRRQMVVGLAIVATAAAGIGLKSISLDDDILLMLPGDEEIRRSLRFLQESHFSDRVIISLELTDSEHSRVELAQAVEQLGASLGAPLVTEVVSGASETDMLEEMLSFLRHLPELLDEKALSEVDEQLTPEGVRTSLRRDFRQLVAPSSAFMVPFIRSDPLGLSLDILRSMQGLSSSMGYEVEIEDGHFVSRDGAHAMLVLRTPVTVTDASGARELISYLRKKLKELPDSVSGDIVAGHLHTISNEDVIKKDIWLALSVAGVGFLLLFLFLFRDIKAVMLFVMPLASVLVAINLSSIFLSRLSHFIVGMGGVVAGIAVDYGIHVYMAVRTAKGQAEAVKLVAKPVVTGALTTLGVFAAFFFSSVQGYHQLAFFSISSIVLCLGCALFLLPQLLSRARRPGLESAALLHRVWRTEDRSGAVVACWALAMIAAAISCRELRFDSDVRQFDGSESWVFQAEEKFHRVWGGEEQPAILVVAEESLEAGLRRNSEVYQEAVALVGERGVSSLSAIWPPREERLANSARWKAFWRQGREEELRKLLRENAAAYGFSDDAFSPFFENLYANPKPEGELEGLGVFSMLKQRFVQEGQGEYRVLSFFPDEDRLVGQLSAVSARHPGTFLVSRKAISRALSNSVSSEILYLSGIAALLIPILAFLLLRDVRLTALALVPVVSGVMAVLGMIPVLGLFLNAPSLISAMVVVGLCIDYGIFMVYACHHRLETGTDMAVTLSAATTLVGTGVLLFARHPILFSVGVTMTTGILAGYAAAMLVVPCLYRCLLREGVSTP